MAGVVGVWFAKLGREAAPAAEAEVVGRRNQGDGLLEAEAAKTVQIQERRRRNSSVLSNSEDTKTPPPRLDVDIQGLGIELAPISNHFGIDIHPNSGVWMFTELILGLCMRGSILKLVWKAILYIEIAHGKGEVAMPSDSACFFSSRSTAIVDEA
ncbi:hypothetical protein ZWY2020_017698 [Hordeum vulgare]|nr:hypothetical protein ZWY2020_017698 [Hordeum vulgare]